MLVSRWGLFVVYNKARHIQSQILKRLCLALISTDRIRMHKFHPPKMKLDYFSFLRGLELSMVEENPTTG
jgi:hypothetical protein